MLGSSIPCQAGFVRARWVWDLKVTQVADSASGIPRDAWSFWLLASSADADAMILLLHGRTVGASTEIG